MQKLALLLVLIAGSNLLSAQEPLERAVKVVGAKRAADGSIVVNTSKEQVVLGHYRALLIAIDDYSATPYSNLKTPLNDIRRLGTALLKQYGFENVAYLRNKEATRAGILSALRQLGGGTLGPKDNLIIYYAGHGAIDEDNEGYWIPFDASDEIDSWVSIANVKRRLKHIHARHVLLIADSCFSGTLLQRSAVSVTTEPFVKRVWAKDSRQVITSGDIEAVSDSGRDGMSIFAWTLVTLLEQLDSSYITGTELFSSLVRDVTNATNNKQSPQFTHSLPGHRGGDFIFHRFGKAVSERALGDTKQRVVGVPLGWALPQGIDFVKKDQHGHYLYRAKGQDASLLVMVAGGHFTYGESDRPIRVDPFLIDRYEVTCDRFANFLRSRSSKTTLDLPYWQQPGYMNKQQPVVGLSLDHCRAFARWARKKLPTETQWEFAAYWDLKKKRRRKFPWGDVFADAKLSSVNFPPLVTEQKLDRSPFGALGMGSGVQEWCELPSWNEKLGVVRGSSQMLSLRQDRMDRAHHYRLPQAAGKPKYNLGFRCIVPLVRP